MKKITAIILLSIIMIGPGMSGVVMAGNYRWIETDTWEKKGEWTSPLFTVKSDKWRLGFRRSRDSGLVKIHIYNSKHEKVHTVENRSAPFRGYKQFSGRGQYYLTVEAPEVEWKAGIRQYLNRADEWLLMEEKWERRKQLRKLAVWHGDTTGEEMTFQVPPGSRSWRLQAENPDDAELTVKVSKPDDGSFSPQRIHIGTEDTKQQTWFNHTGKFAITVENASGNWSLAVDYYARKLHEQ